jgi:hypothetical protein
MHHIAKPCHENPDSKCCRNGYQKRPGFSRILISSGKNLDKIFVVFGNLVKLLRRSFLKKNLHLRPGY